MIVCTSFLGIFLIFAIYMLIKNKCKFNKRTKVVLSILLITMALQSNSAILTYLDSINKEGCGVYPLGYTILSQQHIFVIVVYSFLVCRMLSIYYKMMIRIEGNKETWKTKWAYNISYYQNLILVIYFVSYTAFIWTFHFLLIHRQPINTLNH